MNYLNSFGRLFRVSVYGESHGDSLGVLLDGVKPGIKLSVDSFKEAIERRKPKTYGTTRVEDDTIIIKSGVFNNYTTGAPILLEFKNNNINSKDYSNLSYHFRPGHSDFAANNKYGGFNDYRGGGTFSGRLTLGVVAAGVVADKIVHFDINSEIINLGGETDKAKFTPLLEIIANSNDSIGGVVRITIKNPPIGLGEPFFDSVESLLSHALFSVGGVKGVSFGAGFNGVSLRGSEFNDLLLDIKGTTKTNNNGGINGGISNGNDIVINVMVRPTPSIGINQNTFNFKTNKLEDLKIEGRHDKAIILRIPVVLESMCKIVLTDLYLLNEVLYNGTR